MGGGGAGGEKNKDGSPLHVSCDTEGGNVRAEHEKDEEEGGEKRGKTYLITGEDTAGFRPPASEKKPSE